MRRAGPVYGKAVVVIDKAGEELSIFRMDNAVARFPASSA
jgi:hypothetical protein